MSDKNYKLLLIETKIEFDCEISELLNKLGEDLKALKGNSRVIYDGNNTEIITALERILNLENKR